MSRQQSGSGTTIVVVAALVLGGLGFYLNWSKGDESKPLRAPSVGDGQEGIRLPEKRDPNDRMVRALRISPAKVELGTISICRPAPVVEIVLSNDGSEPLKVVGWISTCACVAPDMNEGFEVPAGSFVKVPLRVDAQGLGAKSQRLDFRLEGNSRGGSVRIEYTVEGAIVPVPVVAVRPDAADTKIVDLWRIDEAGKVLEQQFTVRSVEPPVAKFIGTTGNGHAAIEIDYKAIDALAEAGAGSFEWHGNGESRRWKSLEITVDTDCPTCERMRMRVRNR
jgi:hypothetical protein